MLIQSECKMTLKMCVVFEIKCRNDLGVWHLNSQGIKTVQ